MNTKNNICLFNVDTQVDFIEPFGKLYIDDAETFKSNFKKILSFAKDNKIKVISTADWHYNSSKEISKNPDFKTTFPEHCIANTYGATFIDETNPYLYLDSTDEYVLRFSYTFSDEFDNFKNKLNLIKDTRNIIITKDAFDVFEGNFLTQSIIDELKNNGINTAIVFGVAGNVCVNFVIEGLKKNGFSVMVITDAIKDLNNIPSCITKWINMGIKLITTNQLNYYINKKDEYKTK